MYSSVVDRVMQSKQFGRSDFLEQQHTPLADEEGVEAILQAYVAQSAGGSQRRKKSNENKARKVEALLTGAGLRKLRDCKIEIRLRMEANSKEKEKREAMPPVDSTYGVQVDAPWLLIEKMQAWGNCKEDDPKYYLHMVFRYQMMLLHKALVRDAQVLQYPSLQCVADVMFPNTSSSNFPPEFKRFMTDCSERKVCIASLPVPKRDDAKRVTYTNNFESLSDVATVRRKLQKVMTHWRCADVYPTYLKLGREGNSVIIDAFDKSARAKRVTNSVTCDQRRVMGKVAAALPPIASIAEDYLSCMSATRGERLQERIIIFLRPSIRNVFVSVNANGFLEEVFGLTRGDCDDFQRFTLYCNAETPLRFLDCDTVSRSVLLLLESIVFLFAFGLESLDVDPDDTVREAIRTLTV